MSDLVVNIPAVTVTATKPKLTSREDYTNLKRYADAFRRGEIAREKIPYKYRAHLPETREKAQDIAYQQHKDEEKAQDILKQQGWDKLGKAYGIGMSALMAAPVLSGYVAPTIDLVKDIKIPQDIIPSLKVYSINRNSELLNKWSNGQFNWSDITEFGLNLLPGYTISKRSPIVIKNVMGHWKKQFENLTNNYPEVKEIIDDLNDYIFKGIKNPYVQK